jgi:hypothetical protein
MKNKILVFVLIISLGSCVNREIVEIDGCEYIETGSFARGGYVSNLTHKGNCNNPIHFKKDTLINVLNKTK